MKKITIITLTAIVSLAGCMNQNHNGNDNIFLLESESAQIFAPELVSTHLAERDAALSPNGNEFYYTVTSYNRPTIVFIEKTNGHWGKPAVASFSGEYSDLEPHFSPDGNKLYFASNRPKEKGKEPKDFDIWYTEKSDGIWGDPINIGSPINTDANEFYPSITNSGTLYWCSIRLDSIGMGGEDIFYSKLVNNQYLTVEVLSDSINTPHDEFNAFVARDESYIIFTSSGWGAGFGRGDLWISFKHEKGYWTKAANLGDKVNTNAFEYCPFVSDCGKYLFFTSDMIDETDIKTPNSYSDILSFSKQPKNKLNNIYIIDAKVIDDINPLKR